MKAKTIAEEIWARIDDKRMCRDESVNEWTGRVMTKKEEGDTMNEVEKHEGIETRERASCEKNSDDKATLAHSEESSSDSADKEESELGEGPATVESENMFKPREALQGYWLQLSDKRSSAGLLAAVLRQRERV